ncbi:hypothetical protein TYRP_007050 [Tyrophagus putrescentiae]|nr:hypothetical protein TYRP_007050 [Tyrophagus putrescentiae]
MSSTFRAASQHAPRTLSATGSDGGGGGLFSLLRRKVNKFIYGSETPYVHKDKVMDQMVAEGNWMLGYGHKIPRVYAREQYLRDNAQAMYVKHNVHIRHLEGKVLGGAVGVKSFFNRF